MNQLRVVILMGVVLFSTLFFWAENSFAQKTTYSRQAEKLCIEANHLMNQGKDDLALGKFQQVKNLYAGKPLIDFNLVDASFGIGEILQKKGNYKQAIAAYKESVTYEKKYDPQADSSFFYPIIVIADCYNQMSYYDSALTYYEKAEHLLLRYPHIPTNFTRRYYNGIGNLYYMFGNYTQSINYFEKALKTIILNNQLPGQINKNEVISYVIYHNNIAGALRKLNRDQEAIQKLKGLIKHGIITDVLYQNIASSYLQLEQPDSAKTYLAKFNALLNQTKVDPIGEEIDYYNLLGSVYSKTQNYKQALACFDKAQQLSFKNYGRNSNALATAFAGKAQVYDKQRNYPLALQHYQLAIQSLHFTFNNSSIYQNPSDFSNTLSSLLLFEVLKNKADTFRKYFNQTQKIPDLEASLKTYKSAFQLADRVRKGYDSDEAKLFFNRTVSPAYEEAIATAFQLFGQTKQNSYLETALDLAEGSKAAVLAESLRKLEIKEISGISARLQQKEADLKRNNAALLVKLAEGTISNAQKEMYLDRIRENEIELAKVVKEFEKNKQYYQLKYDTEPVKVSQLQEKLNDQTAFVEYFVGKNNLYAFVITQHGFEAKQLGSTAAFRKNWDILSQAFYQPEPSYHFSNNNIAHQLYQQLITPLAVSLAGKERLLIIPDKELGYLPFEALVSEIKTNRYLIQDKIISYAYSGKLLLTGSEIKANSQKASVLAMAPFGSKKNNSKAALRAEVLGTLDASDEEVAQIGDKVYVGPEATKARLLQLAANYDIIHLATHAKANNQDPLQSFIAFYQEDSFSNYRLYVPEIYNLDLSKLKLVVLSACETGSGQLVQGEGIMSLARAFAYAGCPSTITTLWQAEDKATAFITTRLHAHLKAGKPKDEAVRLAKLDYLKNQTNPRLQSPVYWANFIFIGDETPIYDTPNYVMASWISGSVLIVILVLWLFYKREITQKLATRKSGTPQSLTSLS